MMTPPAPQRFTGRHMAAILVGFFSVVVAVNLAMARLATTTFGGVVVENSYVASQNFNRWLDAAEAGKGLGWSAQATRRGDGRIAVAVSGVDGGSAALAGDAWHPLGRMPDRPLAFTLAGTDAGTDAGEANFISTQAVPPGRWRLRLRLQQGGRTLRIQQDIE